jgi:hypothetical protein
VSTDRAPTAGRAAGARRGTALVEALAALALVALAGGVLAAAATTNLRATRAAATLERLTAEAARELALAQAGGAPAGTEETPLAAPGLDPGTTRRLEVSRDDSHGVTTLDLRLTTPGTPPFRLTTRMPSDP